MFWSGGYYYSSAYYMSVGRSSDAGATWTHQQISGTNGMLYTMALDPSHPDTVYAAGYEGSTAAFYRTMDGGTIWTKCVPAALGSNAINAMEVSPANPLVIFAGAGNGIYRSTDFGASFTKMSTVIGSVKDILIDPADPGRIWVATASQGVYASVDGGSTWTAMNEGLTETTVNKLALHPGQYLFAGTDGAASFRWSLSVGVGDDEHAELERPALFASPNPATGGAMVCFTVVSGDPVCLSVYDMQGRLVSRPVDGSLAPGEHEIWWDARTASGSDLQPGVYFLRLVSGGTATTGRLVLVR